MDMNAEFVARMQVQRKAWDAQLEALAAESGRVRADAEMNAWQRLQKAVEKTLSRMP